ncbi:unnamed protein product [Didymodactylos carnosus]|uniref:Uncharacterized protein n=1 Tax=Didymodactylos carnosus TaxID=1234261 RepID=A0A8S2QTA5_9BILA|nr:unnamed protein product [Didymodactylos carnosus]CAF4122115.1 unnamed protein product [Didymodactylos carnosus]
MFSTIDCLYVSDSDTLKFNVIVNLRNKYEFNFLNELNFIYKRLQTLKLYSNYSITQASVYHLNSSLQLSDNSSKIDELFTIFKHVHLTNPFTVEYKRAQTCKIDLFGYLVYGYAYLNDKTYGWKLKYKNNGSRLIVTVDNDPWIMGRNYLSTWTFKPFIQGHIQLEIPPYHILDEQTLTFNMSVLDILSNEIVSYIANTKLSNHFRKMRGKMNQNLYNKQINYIDTEYDLTDIDKRVYFNLLYNNLTKYEIAWTNLSKDDIKIGELRYTQLLIKKNITKLLPIKYSYRISEDRDYLLTCHVPFTSLFPLLHAFKLYLSGNSSNKRQTNFISMHLPIMVNEIFSINWERDIIFDSIIHWKYAGILNTKIWNRQLINLNYNLNFQSLTEHAIYLESVLFNFQPIIFYLNTNNGYFQKYSITTKLLANNKGIIELVTIYHTTPNIIYQYFDIQTIFDPIKHINIQLNFTKNDTNNYYIDGSFILNDLSQNINGNVNKVEIDVLNITLESHGYVELSVSTILIIKSSQKRLKSIINYQDLIVGLLLERFNTHNSTFEDDQDIIQQCNPYLIIQSRPTYVIGHYYVLNDGLTTMHSSWTTSYFSWNVSTIVHDFPLTAIELDTRTAEKIFRLHDSKSKYILHVNKNHGKVLFRRERLYDDFDEIYEVNIKLHFPCKNIYCYQTKIMDIYVRLIENKYTINITQCEELDPSGKKVRLCWNITGQLHQQKLAGKFIIGAKMPTMIVKGMIKGEQNRSFMFASGHYVELIESKREYDELWPFNFQILFKKDLNDVCFDIAIEHASNDSNNFQTIIKVFHKYSNTDLFFSQHLNVMNKTYGEDHTSYSANLHFNDLINETWTFNGQNLKLNNSKKHISFTLKDIIRNRDLTGNVYIHQTTKRNPSSVS